MKKIAVILSGCGVFDGAEIHESVLTLLALDNAGAKVTIFAPDTPQMHVINHQTGTVAEGESRNVLTESARIARGPVTPLTDLDPTAFDAIVLPGGFGAAKNLSTFAADGPNASVDPDLVRILKTAHDNRIWLGFLCISPAIAALVLGHDQVSVTIGTDADTAAAIQSCGATHCDCPVDDLIVDDTHRIISSPAYMLGQSISEVNAGISKFVATLIENCG